MKLLTRTCPAWVLLFLFAAAWGSHPAHADMYSALGAYKKGDYPQAFQDYLALAKLGQPLAQLNVARLYLLGRGVDESDILAYAWASLAAENGEASGRRTTAVLGPLLAPGSKQLARQITAAYTPEALRRNLLPQPLDAQAAKRQWAAMHAPPCWPVELFYPGPPSIASMERNQGRVLVEYTVMPDGTARLPRVLYAYPPQVFDATTREAVLRSCYAHAAAAAAPRRCVEWHDFVLQNGATGAVLVMDGTGSSGFGEAHASGLTEDRMQASEGIKAGGTIYFQNGAPPNGSYQELQYIARKLKINVDKDNDPRADLYYGLLIEGAPQLEKSPTSGLTWLVKAAQAGLPLAQFQVGYRLLAGLECRPDLAKALEWLHLAAAQHETSADLVLAARLLRGTPSAAATARAKEWLEQAVAGGNSYGEMYLAALLATAPDARLRDPARALSLLKNVYAGVHENPTALEIRAAAQAAEGHFAGAVQSEQKAIADAGKLDWDLSPLEERLALYRARKPWHGNLLDF